MKTATPIRCLFVDIGGVLLTDAWDHHARRRAEKRFKLDPAELRDRHHLFFETIEEGRITLDEYLDRVVFYKKRLFTRAQFRRFMFEQTHPCPEMINLVRDLKLKYGLKVVVVSNELDGFVDAFISSCFVHLRKPDAEIFRLALDVAQTPARRTVFIDNTPMFVQVAESLGIRGIHHEDYKTTLAKLAALGLRNGEGAPLETR
jgi:putative hydrolase of the HAD superfamily